MRHFLVLFIHLLSAQTARLLRVQSQQLPTESQVLEDEVPPGTENADQPTEEMSERHDNSRNHSGKVRIELCAKSFGAEGKLAIRHVKKICGDPPPEMELEIVWQEHKLGGYPTIGLVWDDPMRGTPWNYISRCEAALTAFENGGELPPGWTMPPVRSEDELNEPFDPEKPPPEPPDILDAFEAGRILVERDDDPER
jgi:hypothetical protein